MESEFFPDDFGGNFPQVHLMGCQVLQASEKPRFTLRCVAPVCNPGGLSNS